MRPGFREAYAELGLAQKGAARSAPAYSRFVNRRLGRVLAAGALTRGLTPDQVTGISALHTGAAIVLLALLEPSWWLGVLVAVLLVLGYAWDSADGQVARATRSGGPAGEWLDHVVDAVKVVSLPLAVLIGLARADAVDEAWLLVPLASAVVSSVMFFAMILTEQLRRAQGRTSLAQGRGSLARSIAVLPMDYGVLCLAFLLYGASDLFVVVLGLLTAASAAFLALALPTWRRDVRGSVPARVA